MIVALWVRYFNINAQLLLIFSSPVGQVTKTESLFTYGLKTDYEFYNNQPYSPEYKASSDIDSRMVSGFVKTMCGTSKDCMYDYINKGHINVATRPEDRRMRDKFWLRLQDLTTCEYC